MRAILNNPLIVALLGVLAIFTTLLWVMHGQALIVSTNAFRLVVAAAVGVAWLPAAVYYLWEGRPMRRGYLIIGICGSWLSEAAIGGVVVARRFFQPDRPWWLGDETIVLLVFLSIGCGVLHLTAGSMEAGAYKVPTRGWVITGVTVALALLLAIAAVVALTPPWS